MCKKTTKKKSTSNCVAQRKRKAQATLLRNSAGWHMEQVITVPRHTGPDCKKIHLLSELLASIGIFGAQLRVPLKCDSTVTV